MTMVIDQCTSRSTPLSMRRAIAWMLVGLCTLGPRGRSARGLMTRFKIIKHSNHRGSRGEVVGQADCSNAVADYCTKTGTHRLSGRDRAGRKWSIEIGLDLFEQMQLNSALRDR